MSAKPTKGCPFVERKVDAHRADGGVQRAQKKNALSDPSEKFLQNFSSPPFRGGVGAFRCGIFVKIINRLQRNFALCIMHFAFCILHFAFSHPYRHLSI